MDFDVLREFVMGKEKKHSEKAVTKGNEREELVGSILEDLKNDGTILHYERTTKFGIADLKDGVDFYVSVLKRGERMVIPIQVTGKSFFKSHKDRHPKVPIVCVSNAKNRREDAKEKILSIINTW